MNRALRYACGLSIILIITTLVGCGFAPEPTLQRITVTSTSTAMVRGTTQQLVATGQYSDGTSRTLSSEVTWSSSNTSVATISSAGVVTGASLGVVNVSASVAGVSGGMSISVEIHLTSITITGTTTGRSGEALQLTAMGKYDDGSTAQITAAWTSSDATVATVAGGGLVTGVSTGTSTITATSGTIKGTVVFSVTGIAAGTVGNTGGTITASGTNNPMPGVKVEIPAGAVEEGSTVKINVDYDTHAPGALPAGVTQSSNVLLLTKDTTTDFKLPLTVTIPFDPASVAADDVPVVFYWNETYQVWEAASLEDIDYVNHTVSFQTVHFSKFMAMNKKGGWTVNNKTSLDTGFVPNLDGFFHPNFGSYVTPGGNSLGMALYASWYYGAKKQKSGTGLFSKYLEGDVTRWQDDVTARVLISRTYAASSLVWAKLALVPASKVSTANMAQAILTAMSVSNVAQVVILRGKTWAQAVLLCGWDAAAQKFTVYDPNFPGELVTLGWDANGPTAYSKAAAYADPIQNAEFHGMSIALASTEFEQLYASAEVGWVFNQITLNSPTIDANGVVVVQDGSALTVQGSVSHGTQPATAIVYCVNGDCTAKPATVSNNAFNFALPTLTQASNNIMLIATTDPHNPWAAFSGFTQFTIKIQGNVFFQNAGFETGDWTGWTHETHTWQNYTPGSYPYEKNAIVSATDMDEIFLNVYAIAKGYSGKWAARVNNSDNMYHISSASQTVTVPNVSNPEIRFYWAAILEDPQHDAANQPYVDIVVVDETANTVLRTKHFYTNDPAYPGWIPLDYWGSWKAIDWQPLIVNLGGSIGHQVRITVTAADCGYGGHGGYVYLDGDEQ